MPSARIIDQMRAAAIRQLPTVVVVRRVVSQPDGKGGQVVTKGIVGATEETQRLIGAGVVSGGSFTLSNGVTSTVAIPFNAAASQVRVALAAVYGAANVFVSGGPLPGTAVLVVFTGSLSGTGVSLMVVNSGAITGGGSIAISRTVAGAPAPSVKALAENTAPGIERTLGAKVTGVIFQKITLPWNANVTALDEVTIGARTFSVFGPPLTDGDEWRIETVVYGQEMK